MNFDVVLRVISFVLPFTMGVLLIVGALLQRAGIKSFIRPTGFNHRPAPVGANLLFGAALMIGPITIWIPNGPSTSVWETCLATVVVCLTFASVVARIRQKPVIPNSADK